MKHNRFLAITGTYYRRTAATITWAAVLLALTSIPAYSQTTEEILSNLARRIAERRARVETLSDQVTQTREKYDERVRSLTAQIADTEIQINREKLRLEQILQDITTAREKIDAARGSVIDLEPIIRNALEEYRSYVKKALPFEVEDRLAEIDKLEAILDDGNVDAQTVLTRLWNTVQGEYRMAGESGLFRQTIEIDGEEQLAEVARLGMALMYFKTFDGRYGYVVPAAGGWEYIPAADGEEERKIEALFEALRRNLREGFFTLPNPYHEGR